MGAWKWNGMERNGRNGMVEGGNGGEWYLRDDGKWKNGIKNDRSTNGMEWNGMEWEEWMEWKEWNGMEWKYPRSPHMVALAGTADREVKVCRDRHRAVPVARRAPGSDGNRRWAWWQWGVDQGWSGSVVVEGTGGRAEWTDDAGG